jgi:hypothetical protein
MSAMPLTAARKRTSRDVRVVPRSDICSAANCGLFDHLVGARKQRDGRVEAQRFGSPKIYNSFEFGGLLDRKITGLFPLENAIDIRRGAPIEIDKFNAV